MQKRHITLRSLLIVVAAYLRYDDGDNNIPYAIIPISTAMPMMIAHVISYLVFKEIYVKTKKDLHVHYNHVPYLRYDDGDINIP